MRRAMDMIDVTMREVERHPNELMLFCQTAAQTIRQAKKTKQSLRAASKAATSSKNSLALRNLSSRHSRRL